ncbi:MAG: hypothetical protein Pg6C_01000 [Treponemataceae bacterium]|nr:MAG: hypothetical protein Pg6C_01000 [Treponemataceae bacterium]
MLPKLNPLLCLNAVCLSKPLTQAQDSLVDILLKFRRIVKGALRLQGILVFPRQLGARKQPLERTARLVVDLDFFGTYPGFAFELLCRHKEIEQRNRRRINVRKEGLFLKAGEPAVTGILADAK